MFGYFYADVEERNNDECHVLKENSSCVLFGKFPALVTSVKLMLVLVRVHENDLIVVWLFVCSCSNLTGTLKKIISKLSKVMF